nr:stalk domain-containing protein [Sedimentibacter sp.]
MKNLIKKAAAAGLCCAVLTTNTVYAAPGNTADNIGIKLNNQWVQMEVNPFIENDRTLVGLDFIRDELGAEASFSKDGKITVVKEYTELEFQTGKNYVKIQKNHGGSVLVETLEIDAAPQMAGNEIFVPVRYVAENLGAEVSWDNSIRSVIIKFDDDLITVERPISFEEVVIDGSNEKLQKWHEDNYKSRGMHFLEDKGWIYVLISAGEKTTAGYSLKIDSVTEVAPMTAYVHATLTYAEGDFVAQAITYPNAVVKFEKANIEKIQYDMVDKELIDEAAKVENIVRGFGSRLKMVSLLAPDKLLKESMNENYGKLVTKELLEKWMNNPSEAPGRAVSSPWPERIDIESSEKVSDNKYKIKGYIIEVTSVEKASGGIAAKREISLDVEKIGGTWIISNVELGNYQ